eukprot:1930558-Pleurochrysis_carterae.AAC.2
MVMGVGVGVGVRARCRRGRERNVNAYAYAWAGACGRACACAYTPSRRRYFKPEVNAWSLRMRLKRGCWALSCLFEKLLCRRRRRRRPSSEARGAPDMYGRRKIQPCAVSDQLLTNFGGRA